MAGQEKLEVIITAKDQASKVISGIGNAAGGVFKVGMMAAAAGAAVLAAGIGFAISEAMGFQNAMAQLEAVIKSTGGAAGVTSAEALTLAQSFAQVTKFGEEEVLAVESMLLTFTNIGENVFPMATEAVLNLATAMGTDAKGAAIQIGKALNDPIKGITALTRVGVTFTEEQKKMIAGMVEAGDVAGAQALILAELEKEFGGSAEAAGATFGGQLTILKNRLSEVAEAIGLALIPILTSLMTNIGPVITFIENLANQFATLITAIFDTGLQSATTQAAMANIFGPELTTTIMTIVTWFQNLATTISTFVTGTLVPFIQEHAEMFKGALIGIAIALTGLGIIGAIMSIGSAIAALANPITLIIAIAALLGAAWAGNWGGIQTTLTNFWTTTGQPIFDQLKQWLSVNIPIAIAWLTTVWQTVLLPAIQSVWNWLSTVLIPFFRDVIVPWLATNIPIALQALGDFWTNVLKPAIETVWNWLSTVLIPFFRDVIIPWLSENIPVALQALSDFWTNVLKPAIETVWNWLSTVLIPFFQDVIIPWLAENIPAALQTLSDFWTNTLKPAIEIVWEFIQNSIIPLFQALADLISTVLGVAITALTGLWENVLLPAITAVWDFISASLSPIIQTISDLFNNTFGPAIDEAGGTLGILKGIFDGIGSAISSVIGWIQNMIEALSNIELPAWLTPGSPTPFEIGLRGISAAMKELAITGLPQLQTGLQGAGVAAGDVISKTNQTYITLHANYAYQAPEDAADSIRTLALMYGVSS